jgi:lambda family phage tail tape measure protein
VQDLFATVQDQASLAKGLLSDAFKGAEDALVSLVTTGKADFKSLANSIIADLARIQLRRAMASAIDSGSDSSSWLGGIVGAVKAYFGGGASGGTGASMSGSAGMTSADDWMLAGMGNGRASGGYAEPYATYRVNENGAETLQMGSQGGWIMNAKQTRAAQGKSSDNGGKAITVNINQTNNIGSGVSRAEVSAGLAQAKEQAKAELVELMRRSGGYA